MTGVGCFRVKEFGESVRVTNKGVFLLEGRDYTIKYTNNTNASYGAKESKKPRITVTGKGNYTGSASVTFEIEGVRLDSDKITSGDITVVSGTKAGSVTPVLYFNGKKLSKGKDYKIVNTKTVLKVSEDEEEGAGSNNHLTVLSTEFPTLSPDDPNFEKWYAEHKSEWED